ncbi:MAG: plasminogen-binding N-terminal domain-containing protein [Sulfurospirillum sp.]|nr:plasminogen-binding N-terminal domain-containing protein [Sulfurospirillum sp.]MBL0703476.1 plasminogen-binding N-terminal domain-containing protein [Sulfurospirillum sp.]
MHKLLIIIGIFLISSHSLSAKSIFNEFSTKILNIEGETAIIQDSNDIVIGSSGIIVHTFENNISTIIAHANVIKKDGNRATIEFGEYKYLTQIAFPKSGITPAIGDKITLNYLYKRVLMVVPSYEIYEKVKKQFEGISWIHPDIVGAYLAKELKPNPNKKNFQKMCRINSAGLIFFALNNSSYFVDCNNFKVVKELKTDLIIKKAEVPFYTRVKEIKANWMNWNSTYIEDYDTHYRKMIGK